MAADTPAPSGPAGDDLDNTPPASGSTRPLPPLGHLPTPDLAEAVLTHQRERWGAGEMVPAARYLDAYAALRDDPEAAADVVYQEYVLRGGEDPALFDDYLHRFPRYAGPLRRLHEADQIVRQVLRPAAPPGAGAPRRFRDYELIEEVGRGGMGVVYKARQASLGRVVALKMILAGELASADAVERFRNEARAAGRLRHPNIVAVHEVGAEGGVHFFSMDLVDGPTLAELVRDQPLPPAQAARHVEAVARAIQHAHEQGVLHRDLKPSNVLIDRDGQPRVTDFGLARRVQGEERLTGTGQVLGTPSYMPPEQASGRHGDVGPASDVYSLGAVLYELLTGRPPFQAATPFDTQRLVVEAEPVAPRQLNPRIPRDLDTVCLKCLQKDPRRRYATAGQLADDLARHLRGEPVRARPVGPLTRFGRWCRRSPVVAGLSAALLAALLGGLAAVSAQSRRAERHRADAEFQRDVAEAEASRAQANLEKAQDAVDFLGRRIGSVGLAHVPRAQEVQREALEYALKFHEGFLEERAGDPAVRWEAARAWFRAARVRGLLGRLDGAESAYLRGVSILEELPADYPSSAERNLSLLTGYAGLYQLYLRATRMADAQRVEPTLDRLHATHPPQRRGDPAYRDARAGFLMNKAILLRHNVRFAEAEQAARLALATYSELMREEPGNRRHEEASAKAGNLLAATLKQAGRRAEARRAYEEALAAQRRLARRSPGDADALLQLAAVSRNLAALLREEKEYGRAEEMFRAAAEVSAGLTRDFPAVPLYHNNLGEAYHSWGLLRRDEGRPAEALVLFEKASECQRLALAPDPRNATCRISLCKHSYQLADLRLAAGDHAGAAAAAAAMTAAAERAHDRVTAAGLLARCAAMADGDARLPVPSREVAAGVYAGQAAQALRPLAKSSAGYLRQALSDPVFAALRRHPTFQQIELESSGRGQP